jgi:hypothetical protein
LLNWLTENWENWVLGYLEGFLLWLYEKTSASRVKSQKGLSLDNLRLA